MRILVSIATMTLLACMSSANSPLNGEELIAPLIELQSGPLTPGLTLAESPRPIHQVRLVVDADLKSGKLILDGNRPEFDKFGDLISGLQSPYVRAHGKGDAKLTVELATRGSIADGGQARVVVLAADDKVMAVVECVRYGLAIP